MEKISLYRKIVDHIKLESDLERANEVHEDIVKDIEFKGTNLWILILAIVIASIGLNINSPSVVIGAMLISPIDGPIKGLGYSIATYNFSLFKSALKNLTLAIAAGLLTSVFYFLLSPISGAQSEILVRISPTIFDVLIALSAGLAGIIALKSKHKGNVIPGVAIATALMPPICTAGYGLATGQFKFFFGASYLFIINTVFIAFAAIIVSQVLKFPIRKEIDDEQKKKLNRWITIVILLILIPSVYFGYRLVKKEQFFENVNNYIENISIVNGNYLLDHEISYESKNIQLIYGGTELTVEQKKNVIRKLKDFHLDDIKIEFVQGFSLKSHVSLSEKEKLNAELNALRNSYNEKLQAMNKKEELKEKGFTILSELKPFYEDIESVSYSETLLYKDTVGLEFTLIYISSKNEINKLDQKKINTWLKRRLKKKNLKVIFEYNEDIVQHIISDNLQLND